jgi:hypothetical protein
MCPVSKHAIQSKISAKRPRVVKDSMELLEEGLYSVNISNAMDLDTKTAHQDYMSIDLSTVGSTRFYHGFPPPDRLVRSTNSASLLVLPFELLPSALGIV